MSLSLPVAAPAFPASPNWYLPNIASCTSGGILAFGARNDVYILEVQSQHVLRVLQGHTGRVTGTAFCDQDAGVLVSSSSDQSIILWNYLKGTIIEKLKEHNVRTTGLYSTPKFELTHLLFLTLG